MQGVIPVFAAGKNKRSKCPANTNPRRRHVHLPLALPKLPTLPFPTILSSSSLACAGAAASARHVASDAEQVPE